MIALLLVANLVLAQADCKANLLNASNAGIVTDASVDGSGVHIVVSEDIWRRLSFAAKQSLADTVNCAIAGDGGSLASIDFLSDMTNRSLGHWSPLGGLSISK